MPAFRKIYDKTKDFFTNEQTNILKISFTLMIVILITKVAGFLSSAILNNRLGASRESDLFFLANTIPEMLGNLLLIGLASAVFVPVFIKAKNNIEKSRFHEVFNSLLNLSLIVYTILAIVISIFADKIFPIFLNTFVHSQFEFSQMELMRAADMMRLLMIPQIFLGIGAYYTGGLNAYNRFVIPQLAPLFFNVGRIIGAYFFVPIWGVEGLVYGTIIGSLLYIGIQLPLAIKVGIRHAPILDLRDKEVLDSIRVGIPRMLGLAGEQIGLAANRLIAARFVAGSVTAYNLGVQMISIPLSLFGATFSVASFPALANAYQSGNKDEFVRLLVSTMQQILFLAIPTTFIILVLRVPLVRLLYGTFGGQFVWDDTLLTAWVVLFFTIGLSFESLRTILYRSFYAVGDTIRPLFILLLTTVVGISTSILFANYFSNFNQFDINTFVWDPSYFFNYSQGHAAVGGSALGSSITYILEFFVLLILFNKFIFKLDLKSFGFNIFKKLLAGILMVIIIIPIYRLWGDGTYQERTVPLIILSTVTGMLGILSYLIISYILRVKELSIFTSFIKKISPSSLHSYIGYIDKQL
jgi:putative peptidoglycan lipid II flippase